MINTKGFQFISHKMYKRSIQNLKWYICIHMYVYIYSKSSVPCTDSQQATPTFQISERNKKSSKHWQLAPYTRAECTDLYPAPTMAVTGTGSCTATMTNWEDQSSILRRKHLSLLKTLKLDLPLRYSRTQTGQRDLPTIFIIMENTVALFQANGVVYLTSRAL